MQKMNLSLDTGTDTARRLRGRSLANLLRMGHCAPTIMQTVLDVSNSDAQWLVKLLAGLPGGIGNTGGECGGVTAPLVLLGLKHAREVDDQGVPVVVSKGQALLQRFSAAHGTTSCRVIRGDARVPLRCIRVIREAPVLAAHCLATTVESLGERQPSYAQLCAHWRAQDFHCAHAVLRQLEPEIVVTDELLDATSGFIGGTALAGLTCSALTAGIMALGLALGEIENSRLRVVRMIGTMVAAGDAAFADELNAFNRVMNLGRRLAQQCAAEFGSIQCRRITQSDFATSYGVQHYISSGCLERCRSITRSVARRVRDLIATDPKPLSTAPKAGGAG